MTSEIFKKMKVQAGMRAHAIHEPQDYPYVGNDFTFHTQGDNFDFVHLFVQDTQHLAEEMAAAEKLCRKGGLLWVSVPRKAGQDDVSKEELKNIGKPLGLRPVHHVELDNNWDAFSLEWV